MDVDALPRNPKVDEALSDSQRWWQETDALRDVLLQCGLTEELKWRLPCYTHEGRNICIIQPMKDFVALLFFKGALLKDPDGILERQGPNSRTGFRTRFTSVQDIAGLANSVKAYAREAVEVEEAGLQVEQVPNFAYPEELTEMFDEDPDFKAAFDQLTPGRQRGYVLHFAGAKQSKTRVTRIEKHRPRILEGKGIQDR
ncbi:MAG: YdeI/OmpD-associated family protein [Gammaproteobacteria bacterium]|nr:YdeI/OmpD-associated family protein [Gammaproteobacteria bacterium]MDE0224035.1 YdeI/OmpD-associated family protein [Gammaproteobacteria bacterium]